MRCTHNHTRPLCISADGAQTIPGPNPSRGSRSELDPRARPPCPLKSNVKRKRCRFLCQRSRQSTETKAPRRASRSTSAFHHQRSNNHGFTAESHRSTANMLLRPWDTSTALPPCSRTAIGMPPRHAPRRGPPLRSRLRSANPCRGARPPRPLLPPPRVASPRREHVPSPLAPWRNRMAMRV